MANERATFSLPSRTIKQIEEISVALVDNKSRVLRQAVQLLHETLFNHPKNVQQTQGDTD